MVNWCKNGGNPTPTSSVQSSWKRSLRDKSVCTESISMEIGNDWIGSNEPVRNKTIQQQNNIVITSVSAVVQAIQMIFVVRHKVQYR